MRIRLLAPLTILLCTAIQTSCAQQAPTTPGVAQQSNSPSPQGVAESATSPTGTPPADAAQRTSDPSQLVSRDEAADGWISLFDGETLFGWQPGTDGVNWRVEDGVITADDGPIGLLCTSVPFADYEFVCDFRMAAGGNSGVFLRTTPAPEDVGTDCYEVNIADTHPGGFTTGSIVFRQKTGAPILGSPEWKTFKITAKGPQINIDLDGQSVMNFNDEADDFKAAGLIGLQHNTGKIEFRNIRLKPLSMESLFNGKDLTGWRAVPGSKSEFSVEDGTIRVKNGQGFYETEETFADFIFQAEAITHGEELNSGYFFRAMAGTKDAPSNGYEVQIHNGFTDDDRTKPNNAGTGAIFRRVEARRVVPNDNEWFTTTLVAAGPQIAVWVDGYQVVDWTDDRAPDPNPRQGLRTDAGHISLQGHDPTTDLQFRNLHISRLP